MMQTFPLQAVTGFMNRFVGHLSKYTIDYWQQSVFYTITFFALAVGAVIIVPSSIMAFIQGRFIAILAFSLFLISFSFFLLNRNIPYRIKSTTCSLVLLIFGFTLMIIFSPLGDSRSVIMAAILFAAIFGNRFTSLVIVGLSFAGQVFIGWLYTQGIIHWAHVRNFDLPSWALVCTNALAGTLILIFSITTLISRSKKVLDTIHKNKAATVIGLAKLAEYRDTDTGLHLDRISLYATMLAKRLAILPAYEQYITERYLADLHISSTLHDIGKVGIPDSILLKPGILTEEEFECVKRHTVFGKRVVEEICRKLGDPDFLDMAANIIYCHHERWDGSGYPQGLRGEDIPLSARIVAITDVYDALTSRRPYKEPYSHEKACAIINDGSGRHFDPIIVEAFNTINERFKETRTQLV